MIEQVLHFGPFSTSITSFLYSIHHLRTILVIGTTLSFTTLILMAQLQLVKSESGQINNTSLIRNLFSDNSFIFLSIALLFVFRSLYFYHDELNPDEGMHLTAALNLLSSPKLWVSADATTLGPVCQIILVLFSFLFGGISFALARFTATIFIAATFFILYKTLKINLSTSQARLLSLFYVFFMAFGVYTDVQAYNCEIVANFFMALSLYLIFSIKQHLTTRHIFFLGLTIGLLPYVKLQTIPLVFVLIAWSLFIIYKNKPKLIILLLTAFTIPSISLLLYCATYKDGVSNAIFYYLVNANDHMATSIVDPKFFTSLLFIFAFFVRLDWYNYIFAFIPLTLLLFFLFEFTITIELIFSSLLLGASLFSVLAPLQNFSHYVIFLILPVLIFCAMSLKSLRHKRSFISVGLAKNSFDILMTFLYACMLFTYFIYSMQTTYLTKLNLIGLNKNDGWYEISKIILSLTRPGDSIVVWGWEEKINVYTNLKSATAQNNIERIINNKYKSKNVDNYLNDIKKNSPKLIIDVVAPGSYIFTDSNSKYSLSNQKKIFPYIQDHYQLYCKINKGDGDIKIYLRKDSDNSLNGTISTASLGGVIKECKSFPGEISHVTLNER